MIIGIIGCRARDTQADCDLVDRELKTLLVGHGVSIVSGGCPKGGDRFAEILAEKYGLPIKIYRADWDKYGKSAGYKRNIFIANDADMLIACVSKERVGGTEHTINLFKKHNPQGEVILV